MTIALRAFASLKAAAPLGNCGCSHGLSRSSKTFSIGFTERSFNELAGARQVAERARQRGQR